MQWGGPPEALQGIATSLEAFADDSQFALLQDDTANAHNSV